MQQEPTSPTISENYQLEVITPTFIGDSSDKDYMLGEDYYYDDAEAEYCFINKKQFQLALTPRQRSEYIASLLKNDTDGAEAVLKDICLKKQNIIYRKIRCLYFDNANKKVRKHITNGFGEIFVPGSSIKGAIRSIIGKHLMRLLNKREFIHEDLFGRINNNLMRLIQVGDVTLNKTSGIFAMKIFSGDVVSSIQLNGSELGYEGKGFWKHRRIGGHEAKFNYEGFVSIFETLQPGSSGPLRVNFTNFDELKKLLSPDKYPVNVDKFDVFSGDKWMEIARNQTKEYLEQEVVFFNKFPNSDFPEAFSLIDKLQNINNTPGSVLLRLGQGSGYHAITGNWKYKNHTQTGQATGKDKVLISAIKYKTRKIVFTDAPNEDFELMLPGFVKISKKFNS